MDKGPHIIPLVPGGVPVIIHVSQYEFGDMIHYNSLYHQDYSLQFKLLKSDNTFMKFNTQKNGSYPLSLLGRLYCVRPDGKRLEYGLNIGHKPDPRGGTSSRVNLEDVIELDSLITGLPGELTEVAGDVDCEIFVMDWEFYDHPNVYYNDPLKIIVNGENVFDRIAGERTVNFIIRVEPRPSMSIHPFYSITDMPIDQSNNQENDNAGSYYFGDKDDETLLTWEEVVKAADEGSLYDILAPGQLIRPVKLKSGELMGIRCVHVDAYNIAYFEPQHLFIAPKKFNISGGYEPRYVYGGDVPIHYLGSLTAYYEKGQRWEESLPYSVSSRIKMKELNETGIFGGKRMINGVETEVPPYDLYKTSNGRIKKSTDGVARQWYINGIDGGGWVCVEESGLEGRTRYQDGDDIYVNPFFYIVGKEHTDPATATYDIQSWQDVKDAAAKGKLKNSTLEIGQLMPELPTLGVLRCVHIEDKWAAFDETVLTRTSTNADTSIGGFSETELPLTDEEKNIFTILFSSTYVGNTLTFYGQAESGYNNWYATSTTNYNIGAPTYNETLKNTRFDYYADGDATKRIKVNSDGIPVTYWGTVGGTGSAFSQYYFNTSGGVTVAGFATSPKKATHYVNGVFIVGEIS